MNDTPTTAARVAGHERECSRVLYGSGHPMGQCDCDQSPMRRRIEQEKQEAINRALDALAGAEEALRRLVSDGWSSVSTRQALMEADIIRIFLDEQAKGAER